MSVKSVLMVACSAAVMVGAAQAVAAVKAPADLRFLTDDALRATASWGSETREAAAEAYDVLQLALTRLKEARATGDVEYFTGAGPLYMRREWPLFKAQSVAAVFAVQERDARNQQIAVYRPCQDAAEAFGNLYHTYRSALLGGTMKDDFRLREKTNPMIHQVEAQQAACKRTF